MSYSFCHLYPISFLSIVQNFNFIHFVNFIVVIIYDILQLDTTILGIKLTISVSTNSPSKNQILLFDDWLEKIYSEILVLLSNHWTELCLK